MVQLITTMNDCIKIRYEASIQKHPGNMICLDIRNNRLINMLSHDQTCRIAGPNGNSHYGTIRDIQCRNGSATVTFQPAGHPY